MVVSKKSNIIRKKDKDLSKEKRIKKEYKKLVNIYKFLQKDVFDLHEKLINNAAFLSVTLEDLQETIIKNGYAEEYQNGENQRGFKKTPAVDVYATYLKNYNSVIKSLNDLLPKNAPTQDMADDLLKFMGVNKK